MRKQSAIHRKIYENFYGPIPIDDSGRTYEIHHIDGNHANNDPKNLIAITIQEHYNKHYEAGDWKACVMIGLRMKLPPKKISELNSLAAKKRVLEGTHHWTKEDHANAVKKRINESVKNGTYHMLGGELQRKFQKKRVENQKHQWCGPRSNLKMLAEGTHPSQSEYVCPHCGKKGKGITNAKRWHFENCQKKG